MHVNNWQETQEMLNWLVELFPVLFPTLFFPLHRTQALHKGINGLYFSNAYLPSSKLCSFSARQRQFHFSTVTQNYRYKHCKEKLSYTHKYYGYNIWLFTFSRSTYLINFAGVVCWLCVGPRCPSTWHISEAYPSIYASMFYYQVTQPYHCLTQWPAWNIQATTLPVYMTRPMESLTISIMGGYRTASLMQKSEFKFALQTHFNYAYTETIFQYR